MIDIVNVGHGGGLVVSDPETRRAVIIDAGRPEPMRRAVVSSNSDVAEISAIIVTHLDEDHCRGVLALLGCGIPVRQMRVNPELMDLLKRGRAKRLAASPGVAPTHAFTRTGTNVYSLLLKRIVLEASRRADKAFNRPLHQGDELSLGGSRMSVLWPPYEAYLSEESFLQIFGRSPRTRNDLSIAVRIDSVELEDGLVYGGDCPIEALDHSDADDWRCSFLVFPHHGGLVTRASANAAAVDRIFSTAGATTVVFQIGSRPGFPRLETLNAAQANGVDRVVCTGLSSHCCSPGEERSQCGGDVRLSAGGTILTQRVDHRGFVERNHLAKCRPKPAEQ